MGSADRDYSRGERRSWGTGQGITPVVKWLLIINIVVFVVDFLLTHKLLTAYGAFSIPTAIYQGKIWQFITFQFLHDSPGHILFNSIGLYFFGPWMERWWGSRKFVAFYLLCGIAGAVLYSVLTLAGLFPIAWLVGASAGIYGIFVGVAVIAPAARVSLLFPPVEMSMRTMALAMTGIAAFSAITGFFGNAGGEAGHLGGAILGFFLTRNPNLLGWAERKSKEVQITRPKAFKRRSEAKIRPRSHVDLRQSSEVDAILDKISRDGFQSLTQAERDTLQRASKSHQANR